MALATSTIVALALAAAAAGTEYYNTERTAHRQDASLAQSIRNQGRIQKEGDAKVNATVDKLAASKADAAREQRLEDYRQVLQRNRGKTTAGLTPGIGGKAFQADATQAAGDTAAYADKNAGLMARMDAPGLQRQAEGFDYGRLGTDLGLVGRESAGQQFLDQVKLNAIRRNAKLDLAAGLMSAAAGGAAGGATGATGSAVGSTGLSTTRQGGYTMNMPY